MGQNFRWSKITKIELLEFGSKYLVENGKLPNNGRIKSIYEAIRTKRCILFSSRKDYQNQCQNFLSK